MAERAVEPCRGCGGKVERHEGENDSHYFDRRHCSHSCVSLAQRRNPKRPELREVWPPRLPEHEDFGAGFGAHNLRFRPNVVRYAQPVAMHSYASSSAAWEAEE